MREVIARWLQAVANEGVMSACSRTSVGDHSGLREAQVARASTVRDGMLQGDDWVGTHVPNMKCTDTIS